MMTNEELKQAIMDLKPGEASSLDAEPVFEWLKNFMKETGRIFFWFKKTGVVFLNRHHEDGVYSDGKWQRKDANEA